GEAAGETRPEIDAGAAEHDHHAVGHVLAAVIADALDDRDRARVAHGEPLAGRARGEQLAAGRAVQAGVADDDRVPRHELRAVRRPDHEAAAAHALADVVVRVARQREIEPGHVPGAEALPGRAAQADVHRRVRRPFRAVAPRNL